MVETFLAAFVTVLFIMWLCSQADEADAEELERDNDGKQ